MIWVFAIIAVISIAARIWINRPKTGTPSQPNPKFAMGFHVGTITIQGDNIMARITTEQRVKLTINPLTQAGNPAPIDGPVSYNSSNEDIVSIEQIDDTSAWATATGEVGASQIFVMFDADLGEGVRTIELSGALEVVDAEAVTGELVFGDPELIPVES